MKGKTAYVVADLEGSTGAWTRAHTLLGTPEWQEARVEVTRDINAVFRGPLRKRGQSGGGEGFSPHGIQSHSPVPRQEGDARFRLLHRAGGGFREPSWADFAFFVGLHASGGNQDGFLPHTLTSRIGEIRVNGKRICEAELFASVLAPFGVPVVFFSGCPAACREIEERMPWVAVCPVPKDPLVLRDASKKRETISRMRERLREKVREMPDPKDPPCFL